MALVARGRRSPMVAEPTFERRWQRLRGARGLHRIGRRGAIARGVAASVLTAALASGAGWQVARHLTWDGLAGAIPDPSVVSVAVLSWVPPRSAAERPAEAFVDRADATPGFGSAGARYVGPGSDYLPVLETAPVSQPVQATTDAAPPAAPTATAVSAVAPATQATTVHVVRTGDTLSAIAAQYGTTVADIVRLNRLSDPDQLSVGVRLQVRG